MITAFEIGAVFRIINKASPTLTAILRQVRALNAEITKAQTALADLGKGNFSTTGLKASIGEVDALAASWRSVGAAATQAKAAIGSASTASVRGGAAAAFGGGGGRGGAGGAGGAAGAFNLPKAGRGIAAAGLGMIGYGVDLSMKEQDAIMLAEYAAGLPHNDATDKKFRDIIEDTMKRTGYGVSEVSQAMLQGVRMLQGTPGGGLDILPELMVSAATEARNKPGTSLSEAMTAGIGLAHMTKEYDPAKIRALLSQFAFLSTVVPGSLQTMERSLSYSVPILQSGMGVDPQQTMLLGAALQRAGVTASKSGTWLRDVLQRGLSGTALQSGVSASAHQAALQRLGLVDASGKALWTDANGHLDTMKFFELAGNAIDKIPMAERGALEKQAFGVRGAGAFAVLSDPKVLEQVQQLRAIENSEAFKNRYNNFQDQYNQNSSAQKARVALQTFNLDLMKIGTDVLPSVNKVLGDFIGVMDKLRDVIPGTDKTKTAASIGATAIEGGVIGAAAGSVMPGVGTLLGGGLGLAVGGAYGAAEAWMHAGSTAGSDIDKLGTSAAQSADQIKRLGDALKGAPSNITGWGSSTPAPAPAAPSPIHKTSLTLNLDGRTLAQAMSEQLGQLMTYRGPAPVGNDAAVWSTGDSYGDDI